MKVKEPKAIDPSQLDIPSRRQCVKVLYLLGVSLQNIANYTGISFATVRNDYRHITEEEKASRPHNEKDAFKAQFYYFEQFRGKDPLAFTGYRTVLHTALIHALNINDCMLRLDGIAETMNRLAIPHMTKGQARYYMLFAQDVFQCLPSNISADAILNSYYAAIKTGSAVVPNSCEGLFAAIADYFIAAQRQYAMPSLPNSFLTDVAEAFSCLSDRERIVLEMRYGLIKDSEPKNLYETGMLFGVTGERIRQIVEKVISKLRSRKFRNMLQPYFQPYDCFHILEKLGKDLKDLHLLDDSILSRSIDYLELSVRSYRCLKKIGICSLDDLIRHSETELKDIVNFGTVSLQDVKRKLDECGLQLRQED